jgi:hypothetical protein
MCSYGGYHGTCDTGEPFHEKRRIVPKEKNAFALNEKTMGGIK